MFAFKLHPHSVLSTVHTLKEASISCTSKVLSTMDMLEERPHM